jgi:hypothetical protein
LVASEDDIALKGLKFSKNQWVNGKYGQ